MSRAVLLRLLALLALSACSPGSTGGISNDVVGPSGTAAEQRTSLQTRIACRNRVNEMYDRRDRAEIYTPASTVNTPLSSNYQAGVSSRGLANQFDYERTRVECERNSGTGSIEPTAAPAPPPVKKTR
jgi:hypothetical protein